MSQYVAICHNVNIVLYVLLLGLGTVFQVLQIAAKAVEDLKIKILEICIRICPNRFIVFYPSLNCVSVF